MPAVPIRMRAEQQADPAHAHPWPTGQGGVQLQHMPDALLGALHAGETRECPAKNL